MTPFDLWHISIRSEAIREFCEAAGVDASVEALNLPDDVRIYRMEMAVALRAGPDLDARAMRRLDPEAEAAIFDDVEKLYER